MFNKHNFIQEITITTQWQIFLKNKTNVLNVWHAILENLQETNIFKNSVERINIECVSKYLYNLS